MAQMTLVQAINHALAHEMERDERIVVLGEDVGLNGGVFRVTEGLQKRFGPERVADTPLAESGIMGTAIGLAMAGMRPVPEIQFEGFLGPAYDQLVNHAARYRTRSRGAVTIPLTVRVPVGGGIHAPELHSDSPEAIYAHHPGLKVVMPSTPYDAKGLLLSAIRDPDPVVFFEPKRVYRSFREDVPEDDYTIPIGQAKVVAEGTDVTVVTWGAPVFQCLAAMDELPEDASVELVDLRTIYPIDTDTIVESVRKTGRCVVVHEAPKTAGLGAEIATIIQEHCFLHLEAPVQRCTGFDTVMPYYKLELDYLPEAPRIRKCIEECLAY
ncbi:MAG: alpha-ketoacid dehydrogenase subunit beta [Leptolyngbya sp. PLA2]|nr:alpha-ketoacid dehydrogenase subunit beta [Leptolyngbya sp. PL-A2]MCQ3940149.1 alpha-ketoacid dehydrogenase subunit beta [cyanobacterium CYA1]MCZ7632728.1 alpha-ketoacid dehydrogenase subunit beta [Phycisphaerales bacterium]MDL1904114.1 alpha-ketoacid dehydrogenase subunit beta [Synechococcales cyanobacterium CNB]GIK20133.1 MAG: 2-oxoisovalerate dehydrogenase subunit beta [Planctomycetota bacterium]